MPDHTGRHEIWRVRFTGGNPEQVTGNCGLNALETVDGKPLYCARADSGPPLSARPVASGPERETIGVNGPARDFRVYEDGFNDSGPLDKGKVPLLSHQFSTRTSRLVTNLIPFLHFGLDVSRDRKTFPYTRSVSTGGDPMFIGNFR